MSVSFYEPRLVISGFSCDDLEPPVSYNPFSFSSTVSTDFGPELVCESLHLLLSVPGQRLIDDN